MKKAFPFIIILVVLAATLGGGAMLFKADNSSPSPTPPAKPTQGPTETRPALEPSVPNGAEPAHIHGDVNAPVTLEEFGDYQCPSCGVFHRELKKIEKDYGAKLKVIFRQFPLQQIHNHALIAARAAEAAGMQGKFWQMHDRLYEQQATWSAQADAKALFMQYAKELGLDMKKFQADIDGSEAALRSVEDQRRGAALGVGSTPTVLVNGRIVKPVSTENVRSAIEVALREKGQ